ncbi:MAG TPA: phosphatidate cytidylyltransferase [Candidatus Acidoferrales bacterium]|nr:phosphatidate cytidylyltransferase [Candidatus Acidoferrales bacterium]
MNSAGTFDRTGAKLRRELTAKRIAIGVVVGILGIASIANPLALAAVIAAIALAGAVEFSNLARRAGGEVSLPIALVACAAYPTLAYFNLLPRYESALLALLVLASFVAALPASLERFDGRVAMTVLASLYLGKLLSYFIILRALPHGARLVVWIVLVVVLTDTVGMIAGLRFGHRPLAPRLSPGKTWEGAIAALATAGVAGGAIFWILGVPGPLWVAAALPLSVSIAAQFGDLVESALKRNAQVKDSGHLLASHGGVLDRFDSYIFAGVVGYAVLLLAGMR